MRQSAETTRSTPDLIADRARLMGPKVPTFYDDPVQFVRGDGVWLWDVGGRKYLDYHNNVPFVGHYNPCVVDAIARQAPALKTCTCYLHDGVLDYIERLTATMHPSLDTAIMNCTGFEAKDIALRIAEAVTGKRGIIAIDATYHGNMSLVSQLSPSNVPSVGFGLEQYYRLAEAPDSYRNPDPDGAQFAAAVANQLTAHEDAGTSFAALVICPYLLNEGFPDHPDG